ncbi:DUF6082 family protein [Streptomyces sp. DSM 118878]
MKLTTAVLAAGAAISLTTAGLAAARLRQEARHQAERNEAERNEAAVARNQFEWLARVSTDLDLAKLWAPEDVEVQEYLQLLKANQLICIIDLRDRLGFVREGQLPFYAETIMGSDVCRRYWHRFGGFRAQEAEGDKRAEHFTRALDQAAKNHPQAQPAAV